MAEPDVRVYPDAAGVAAAAAGAFSEAVADAVVARGRFTVALSGGGTPLALYRALARPPHDSTIPWESVYIFWGDERLVPPDDPESNYAQARAAFLDALPIPPANIHRARGILGAAAVIDYAAQLRIAGRAEGEGRDWPRFDLVLLGLGSDGHTASLFPGSPAEASEPVVQVAARYEGRPADRLTLTPRVFNDARRVWFLVTGEGKAAAVTAALREPPDPQARPAQRIHPAGGTVTWWLDAAAARLLA